MRIPEITRLVVPRTLAVLAFSVGCTSRSDSSTSSSSSSSGGIPDAAAAPDAAHPMDAALPPDAAPVADAAVEDDAGTSLCPSGCAQLQDADGGLVFYPDDGGPYCLC